MPVSSMLKLNPFQRNHLLRDASLQAVYDAMQEDPTVHTFGEGAHVKVHYDAPQIEATFRDRVHTLPITEDGNTNFAVGAALLGVKPIVDVISADFLYRTMDSICNTAAKQNSLREKSITMVVRAEFLVGGPTTGQRPEALFAHIPGLRVVIPSTPHDAYGLMRTALETPGVTLFFEDRMIDDSGAFSNGDLDVGERVPFGVGCYRALGQRGTCTIVTYGLMRQRVEAFLALQQQYGDYYREPNMAVGLVDLRTIYPPDLALIKHALGRTGRLLFIEPDITYGGIGAEIVAQIAEECPAIRVKRLGAPRGIIPASSLLHKVFPDEEAIASAIASW